MVEGDGRKLDFDWFYPEKPPIQAWTSHGILCAVAASPLMGNINGYVRIPETHLWRVEFDDYDDIPVSVHGGLTFGPQPANEGMTIAEAESLGQPWPDPSQDKDHRLFVREQTTWEDVHGWIGFDTGHAWDHWSDEELARAGVELSEEAQYTRALTADIYRRYPMPSEDPYRINWTLERLIEEVEGLAAQVAEFA